MVKANNPVKNAVGLRWLFRRDLFPSVTALGTKNSRDRIVLAHL